MITIISISKSIAIKMIVMSVRHKTREYIEHLFRELKKYAQSGEYTIFNIYAKGELELQELELVDVKVDFSDAESVKRFLDKTTRETLEGEVKGLKLVAMVIDKGDDYIFSSQVELDESIKESIKEKIEQLKEE
jgi:ribosome-associated translation inhibitor RaiA